ncbi:hypothetical protein [Micromonospora trifolii]|uniref:hypothetical protein n=1 Tax=Micromonospora trifolii TaxID=2911208 RepID=UPI003CF8ED80
MVRYKYTPEALAAAAAVARNITEVMRLLGVRVSGGSHAHISRQLRMSDRSGCPAFSATCLVGDAGWGHGTISTILREAGLNTADARRSRLSGLAGVA